MTTPATPDGPPFALRTHGISLAFGKVKAVDGLDMTVSPGQVYGFLGRNGAGKTTAIRALMGIIRSDSGTLEIFGEKTRRTTMAQKRRIGYVSQGQFFYPWMTCSVLGRFVGGFFPTWDPQEFARLLRVLDVPSERKVSALSGGTRVKLALALALAHKPDMLILDEPTSGLDPVARREFLDLIGRQARAHGRTTLFSSHLVDEVERVADRVGIIHKGKMRYEGDVASLRAMVRQVRVSLPSVAMPPVMGEAASTAMPPPETSANCISAERLLELVADSRFRVLKDTLINEYRCLVVSAPVDAWDTMGLASEAVGVLSLEDIFIAIAGETTADL